MPSSLAPTLVDCFVVLGFVFVFVDLVVDNVIIVTLVVVVVSVAVAVAVVVAIVFVLTGGLLRFSVFNCSVPCITRDVRCDILVVLLHLLCIDSNQQ